MLIFRPLFLFLAVMTENVVAFQSLTPNCARIHVHNRRVSLNAQDDEWKGDVVSNTEDGKIRGCTVQTVGDSIIDWIIQIDGSVAFHSRVGTIRLLLQIHF